MKQEKRKIRSYQEYPGSTVWSDWEVVCPHCKKWVQNYGEIASKDDDGDWHELCNSCKEN